MKDTSESKDIFSWLLADEETGIKMSKGIMQAEGRLIIVAGRFVGKLLSHTYRR